jgi:hypothetical protein
MRKMRDPPIFPPASGIKFALFALDKQWYSQHIALFHLLIFLAIIFKKIINNLFDI